MRIRMDGATVLPILLLGGSVAGAQSVGDSFEQLEKQVAVGDTVTVTDPLGHQVRGAIAEISSSSLALLVGTSRVEFGRADVEAVSRRDSRRNGVLWGLGVGGVLGAVLDRGLVKEYGRDDVGKRASTVFIATFAGIGAGIGFTVDTLVKGQDVIYSRRQANVAVLPIWGTASKGVSLALRF